MSTASDARFWDRISRKYTKDAIADQGGYERTLDRTRTLLKPDDQVLELGRGTGSTALRLARDVRSYLATDLSAGMIEITKEKQSASAVPALAFRIAAAEASVFEAWRFNAVLGFNYLYMAREVPATHGKI